MIITYAFIVDYTKYGKPLNAGTYGDDSTKEIVHRYPFFQDVHVMIFIGFGFLMTFLKTYSWSAVGMNFILGAWVIQFSIITLGCWKNAIKGKWETIEISLDTIVDADFAAGSILIAFGGLLGKLNFIQYLFMATFQTIIYSLVFAIGAYYFKAVDIGGSMYIHAFGAYFGLAASLAYQGRTKNFNRCGANYNSNTFAFIGTLFLWMYWPSFNGALSSGNAQQRAIINTYLSLTGSCVGVFFFSPLFRQTKFHAEFVLNATLAGGVMIGATADLIIKPWVAMFIGFMAGFVSLVGFASVNSFLFDKLHLHDTCGIHYLHGMPGVFGGVISIILTSLADVKDLGESYKILYANSETRSATTQAFLQFATLGLVIGVSITSGLICGLFLRCFKNIKAPFEDEELWETEEDELELIKWKMFEEIVNSPKKNPLKNQQPNDVPLFSLQGNQNEEQFNEPNKNIDTEMKYIKEEIKENNKNDINYNKIGKGYNDTNVGAVYENRENNDFILNQSANIVDIEENPNNLRNIRD